MDGYNRPEGFRNETKDCTVRALSLAANLPYEKVHEAFKKYGRKDGHAMHNTRCNFKKVSKLLNLETRNIQRSGTVRKLIKRYPKGNIFCLMRGHAFAVIDGVSHDVYSDGCRIREAWIINLEK
jgi:hypothetical protein